MATNNSFQGTIKAYLDKRAAEDSLFAVTYAKENKSIDECISYIMGEMLKASVNIQSGVKGCGMDDNEVYNLAIHYYDEDDIKIEKPSNMRVAVNNSAPKTEVKKEAPKAKIKPAKKEEVKRLSLFDL